MLRPGQSTPVRSSQHGLHPGLDARVRRHADSQWRQPLHPGSVAAFAGFRARWDGVSPVVVDAGCGTGASTVELARRYSDCLVVGVDRSAHRLARAPRGLPENALLLRARLEDIWRLLLADSVRVFRHYLLYPNPWPKPRHLGRRWHGHPVFPVLLKLAARLELRANWPVYLQEFRRAARVCGVEPGEVVSFRPTDPLTPFERKYHASGHTLYRLTLNLEEPR